MLATGTSWAQSEEMSNGVHDIHEEYMDKLENQYTYQGVMKKAKKLQVINSTRIIQRYWRFKKNERRLIAATII